MRSGGHSWAQWSVRTDALVIDLGALRELVVRRRHGHRRPPHRRCRAAPSSAPYLEERGRFFPGGHCPTVGIGGFLLQGGQGWNARGWGWAAEYVEAVDVVTAAGELVHASARRERRPLLGRARCRARLLRRRHPLPPAHAARVPPHLAQTVHAYDLEDFDEVMTWLHETHASVADTVEIVALTKTDPALAPGPVLLVTGLALVGVRRRGRRRAGAVPDLTRPSTARSSRSTPCPRRSTSSASASCDDNPEGHRWAVDNAWLSGPASSVVPAMRRAYTTLPNEKAFTIWFSMAPLRDLPDMAFSLQSEIYLASYVAWESPDDDERCVSWLARRDGRPRAGDRRPVPRRLRPLPAAGEVHVGRGLASACRRSAPSATRTACSSATSPGPDGATNRNHWESITAG